MSKLSIFRLPSEFAPLSVGSKVSKSSKRTVLGAHRRATAKSAATRFSASPTRAAKRSAGAAGKKWWPNSRESWAAIKVLPLPGGPLSKMPRGGSWKFKAGVVCSCSAWKGFTTAERNINTASSWPTTASRLSINCSPCALRCVLTAEAPRMDVGVMPAWAFWKCSLSTCKFSTSSVAFTATKAAAWHKASKSHGKKPPVDLAAQVRISSVSPRFKCLEHTCSTFFRCRKSNGMGKVILASTACGPYSLMGSVMMEFQGTNKRTGNDFWCHTCISHSKRSKITWQASVNSAVTSFLLQLFAWWNCRH